MTLNVIRTSCGLQVIRDAAGPPGAPGSQDVTLLISATGSPQQAQQMLRFELMKQITTVPGLSKASCGEASTDASLVFEFAIDGTPVATVTFEAGGDQGDIDFIESAWGPGVLTLTAPAVIVDPVSNLSITVTGSQ